MPTKSRRHFNFISSHYVWILLLSLLGSVVIYGAGQGQVAYVDALFFASGASTQAGLNTIDVNKLNTFQQAILYLWPMMANPITINAFVVFLRLYWFEKRFQHVAREARKKRSTFAKSRTKARQEQQQEKDVEKGVNGRKITVMLNGARSRINNDGTLLTDHSHAEQGKNGLGLPPVGRTVTDGPVIPITVQSPIPVEPRKPEIKFAHTVTKSDGMGEDAIKLPPLRTDEEHIAILERQRKGDDEVLRIPNPRDVERGMVPKRVEAGDIDESDLLSPFGTAFDTDPDHPGSARPTEGRQQAITIEEPDRSKFQETESEELADDARAAAHTVSAFLKPLNPSHWSRQKKDHQNGEAGAHEAGPSQTHRRRQSMQAIRAAFSRDKMDGTPYLSWEPTIGRNSAFPDLTQEQREELGGIEYRSLKTLWLILLFYFWGFSLFGLLGLLPWIVKNDTYGQVVDQASQSRTWWGFFTANSAFLDVGFTLTPDSMNSFNTAAWPLLLMSFLIVVGNTGFPIMLRFMIWLFSLVVPRDTGIYEELRFLLDHPRRCFTLLFPSGATWWLLLFLVVLNGLDVLFFIVLDLGTGPVVDLPAGIKILNGIFEAASTRTAGFSCVNLAALHPAVQVSYMVMMYISVFPIAISVRRTNVYEEKSLGIYNKQELEEQQHSTDWAYVGSHARRQLSFDLPFIALGFFILAITEGSRLMDPQAVANGFTMYAVLFEIVSAYGTVGMSLGYTGVSASLCSEFSTFGKLIIIAMMIRGRHRGLPYALDRAVLLPGESLNEKDAAAADAPETRLARQQSRASVVTGGPGASAASIRRHKSASKNNNFFTSLLHPGPPAPREPSMVDLHRRSTDPGSDDGQSHATRITSRRTEPGHSRRSYSNLFSPRPRTAHGNLDE